MKIITFLLATVVITLSISNYKQAVNEHEIQSIQLRESTVRLAKQVSEIKQRKIAEQARLAEEARVAEQKRVEIEQVKAAAQRGEALATPASYNTTCHEGIAQAFPASLQNGARIVLAHENGQANPNAEGAINGDGSRDYGCFQINNKAHPAFFATQDWRDPIANAKYAYQIYAGRGNWTAWYAVEGILW